MNNTKTILSLLLIFALLPSFAMAQEIKSEFNPDAVASDDASIDFRAFRFVYGATLTDIEPGKKVRVWIPMATSNHEQDIDFESTKLPAAFQETKETKFGNSVIYFEATANEKGEVPMEVSYRVIRRELTKVNREPVGEPNAAWLEASSLVPNDEKLRKAVLDDAGTKGETIEIAQRLYTGVVKRMKYDKPADQLGWGQGDAVWAVSYTHLRAHETREDLVCRLLLEKKKTQH